MDDEDWAMGLSVFSFLMGLLGALWIIMASVALSGHFFGVWEISWPNLLTPLMALGLIYGGIGVPLFILKRRAEIKEWESREE